MATFGGQLGVAEKALKNRKNRLDEEESKAMGEDPKPTKTSDKEEKASPRPPMSKKWYE